MHCQVVIPETQAVPVSFYASGHEHRLEYLHGCFGCPTEPLVRLDSAQHALVSCKCGWCSYKDTQVVALFAAVQGKASSCQGS